MYSFYFLVNNNYIAKTIFANFFTKIFAKKVGTYLNSLVKELS
ncbi:hypothetical protein BafPKo_X0030 (plasmid) [Borreliella afzelii PKo]|uniref:Uncharacterized protein n=1 Tax=Borreliella afzelii (strain PKo) TaxID=390236 RepID=G0ISQ3_BORAP|nr:hypothetical protein BafPKo_X0030 [Borreliella afzelii PKo]